MQQSQVENLMNIAIKLTYVQTVALCQGDNGKYAKDTHPGNVIIRTNLIKLQKLATSLRKRYENACNYAWALTDDYEKRTEKMEAKANELATELGCKLTHQRDPRGWPFKLFIGDSEYEIG